MRLTWFDKCMGLGAGVSIALMLMLLAISCGPQEVCKSGDSQACKCGDKDGTQTCKDDGTGYNNCNCGSTSTEQTNEPSATEKIVEASVEPEPEPQKEPSPEPEPQKEPGPEPQDEPEPTPEEPISTPEDAGTAEQPKDESVSCAADEFVWKDKCYKNEDFCKGQTNNGDFPSFSQGAQAAMKTPHTLEFDPVTNKPLFCQTKAGFYYLSSSGYGECDLDGDGWINIEAYRAVTSTNKQIQTNARCNLLQINAFVYHAEGNGKDQLQRLTDGSGKQLSIPLVETFRNDGGKKLEELPVYTDNQAPLPKSQGSDCQQDSDCNQKVCYLGNCISGRRFEPAEINTFTKACIAGLDLNDNQLDDATETPADSPTPSTEFKPLLNGGYFIELHYGFFQKDYSDNGKKINVYHIYERTRDKAPKDKGLALRCQEATEAFDPDHWKKCAVKDDQQCEDPNQPGQQLPGLSNCWMKDVKRAIPSLFKCVVHDNTSPQATIDGYFHPDNYGFAKNYNRTRCKWKAKLNASDPTKRDFEFECTADDGQRKPDPSKKEVGWACVSFKKYDTSADYLAGCVDQMAEKVCGTTKDGKPVTYVQLEKDSYGLARAKADCGTSNGKGECDFAQRVCTGGIWLTCNKCDHCPQDSPGARKECVGGVWPEDSCKLKKSPTPETCDGLDNDCDGQIDNGLSASTYYLDFDGDGEGAKSATATISDPKRPWKITVCAAQKPTGYVSNNLDCDDKTKAVNTSAIDVCDGRDNNCNGRVDENGGQTTYYQDDDGDGYPLLSSKFTACVKQGATDTLCKPDGSCIAFKYTNSQGQIRFYVKSRGDGKNDCCDKDANAKPGQTNYFNTKNACGNFDYNCDNQETPDVTTCQCTRSVNVQESGYAWYICEGPGKSCDSKTKTTWAGVRCTHDPDGNQSSNTGNHSCNKTITNNVDCKFRFVHRFGPSGDGTCSGKCGTKKCNKRAHASDVQFVHYVSSDKSSSGADLIAFNKSDYTQGCVFLNDTSGRKPACGESGLVAPGAESGFDKSVSGTLESIGSECTSSGAIRCNGYCWGAGYSWNVTYSKYTFVKQSSTTRQVKCR